MNALSLRLAGLEDAEMIFHWRNTLEVRQFSFNSNPLVLADHIQWFKQSLNMAERSLLIAELDQTPVGVLRFDLKDKRAEVNIFLSPGLAGKGLGTNMLLLGTEWIKEKFPQIEILEAKILANNHASLRAFEKAGYGLKIQVYEKKL